MGLSSLSAQLFTSGKNKYRGSLPGPVALNTCCNDIRAGLEAIFNPVGQSNQLNSVRASFNTKADVA